MGDFKKGHGFTSRRILAVMLLFSMFISLMPVSALATDQGTDLGTTEAASDLAVTRIFGSANGWSSNTNWIGFTLNRPLDLSAAGSNVIFYYEYVEDGIIRQMCSESNGNVYGKNKLWSGYLNDASGAKYSTGFENNQLYSDTLPADTIIMSNLTNVTKSFPVLTAKVQNGDVQYFRVRLIVYDEGGILAYDGYTNWIQYSNNLTESKPKGIQYDLESPYVTDFVDDVAEELAALPGSSPTITIEGSGMIYTTIDAALSAAVDGDTIYLSSGTYTISKQIVIDKELTIVGDGMGDTVIQLSSVNGNPTRQDYIGRSVYPIVYATAALTMKDLTIQGPTDKHHGIDGIYATDDLTLTSVAINDIRCTADGKEVCGVQYGRGVIAMGSSSVVIENSEICRFQKQAIDVYDVGAISVVGTTITGVGEQDIIAQNGIILRGDTTATITDNIISGLKYTADNEYYACSVAIYLVGEAAAEIGGNTIADVDSAFEFDDESTVAFTAPNTLIGVTNGMEYEITFNYQGATGGNDTQSIKVTYGSAVGDLPKPTKNGYTFLGWFTDTDSGIEFTKDTVYSEDSDINLYAQWTPASFTVTVQDDGNGAASASATTAIEGTEIKLTATAKAGYCFKEWQAISGDVTITDNKFTMPAEDVTVKAIFEEITYEVTFNANGGSTVASQNVQQGKAAAKPTDPTREGYNFAGWYSDEELTSAYNFDAAVTSDITLYAQWAIALNTEDHVAYIIGYSDGTVRPENSITRAEATTAFFRLLTDDARSDFWKTTNNFTDIPSKAWYNNAVSTMKNAGIIKGYDDGSFRGDTNITRAEFVVLAARFAITKYDGADKFSDISEHWAAEYINWAAENGWITGYEDGTFRPEQYITRAEAITLINRVLGRDKISAEDMHNDMITWSDNLPNAWYYATVQEATNSHEYIRREDGTEYWTTVTQVPNWTELEIKWAATN